MPLSAKQSISKRDLDRLLDILTLHGPWLAGSHVKIETPKPPEHFKRIPSGPEPPRARPEWAPPFGGTGSIVVSPLFRIRKHSVGFRYLFELLLSFRLFILFRVLIGMPFLS
jgi:hypothetical protein